MVVGLSGLPGRIVMYTVDEETNIDIGTVNLKILSVYCSTALLFYCCTAVLFHCCTAVLFHCCNAVLLNSFNYLQNCCTAVLYFCTNSLLYCRTRGVSQMGSKCTFAPPPSLN